jgi:hypothetical protein
MILHSFIHRIHYDVFRQVIAAIYRDIKRQELKYRPVLQFLPFILL